MKIIGLTGGMGAGKSLVARIFEVLGVPVFYADLESKQLLNTPEIREALTDAFGPRVLDEHQQVDRIWLAKNAFSDPALLQALNAIMHPAVKQRFINWCALHEAEPYVLKEAAILFESGSYLDCAAVIHVTAPEDLRIRRSMDRDGLSEKEVQMRLSRQWTDAQRVAKAHYQILNDDFTPVLPQVLDVHRKLSASA
ncbi:MAG: dephospho-CoA kinase [Flavobacteriales bacterium]|nr:dephospho-CoA kinase [Flavobacteriales bacterium]